MSKELLSNLNGGKTGKLKKFIDNFEGEPRIAWYPSAGQDFRALLYLHSNFSKQNPATEIEPTSPDIFIFSDYFPWEDSKFMDSRTLYSDDSTTVYIEHIEELPKLNLPRHKEIVDFPEGSKATDRAVFLIIKVTSDVLGSFSYPLIYVFAENESFFCKKIIPSNGIISHVIHVRYGGGLMGGGKASGVWLINVLKKMKTEIFITDGHHNWQKGDEFAQTICPEISKIGNTQLTPIRVQQEHEWSNHGDVSWNLIS